LTDAKTIQVRSNTKKQLDRLGAKGDTYDAIIARLIVFFDSLSKNDNLNEAKVLRRVQATRDQVAPNSSGRATD